LPHKNQRLRPFPANAVQTAIKIKIAGIPSTTDTIIYAADVGIAEFSWSKNIRFVYYSQFIILIIISHFLSITQTCLYRK